jgi:hypothetical protein
LLTAGVAEPGGEPGGQLDLGKPGDRTPWWDGQWEQNMVGLKLDHIPWNKPGAAPSSDPRQAGKITFG